MEDVPERRSQFSNLENHRSGDHMTPEDLWAEGMWALHAPWSLLATPLLDYKTPHKRPRVGTHSSEGISLLCPPLPGKAIKLFFCTLPKTPSPRFNSVPVYRGQISASVTGKQAQRLQGDVTRGWRGAHAGSREDLPAGSKDSLP